MKQETGNELEADKEDVIDGFNVKDMFIARRDLTVERLDRSRAEDGGLTVVVVMSFADKSKRHRGLAPVIIPGLMWMVFWFRDRHLVVGSVTKVRRLAPVTDHHGFEYKLETDDAGHLTALALAVETLTPDGGLEPFRVDHNVALTLCTCELLEADRALALRCWLTGTEVKARLAQALVAGLWHGFRGGTRPQTADGDDQRHQQKFYR